MKQEDTPASAQASGRVTGVLNFKERMMLRPGTVVEVKLLQTSPADVAAKELATKSIENPQAPPIPFVLDYDQAAIDPRLSYSVRAKVTRGDRLLLTTDTHYPVLTRGAGNTVDLLMVAPGRSAPNSVVNATLTNTYWKLIAIGSDSYQNKLTGREPHIQFGVQEGIVSGFAGCNHFTGGYQAAGETLTLGEIAATRKACFEGMDVEQGLFQSLGNVDRYSIYGDILILFQGEIPLLRFEAVYED